MLISVFSKPKRWFLLWSDLTSLLTISRTFRNYMTTFSKDSLHLWRSISSISRVGLRSINAVTFSRIADWSSRWKLRMCFSISSCCNEVKPSIFISFILPNNNYLYWNQWFVPLRATFVAFAFFQQIYLVQVRLPHMLSLPYNLHIISTTNIPCTRLYNLRSLHL